MDYKDLMVGDFVYVARGYDKHLTIEEVKGIIADKDEPYPVTLSTGETVSLNDLIPIELTEEILVKNGFEYERNVGYIFDDYDGNVVIYDDYNNRLKILQNHDVSFNRECFSKVCVHYLQHALRLCEIRKEIKL